MIDLKIITRKYLPWFLLVELVSYLGYYWPVVNSVGFIICLLVAAFFAWKNYDYLLALLFAELVIGSKGHLFALSFGGLEISVRMMFWLVAIVGWLAITSFQVYKSSNKKKTFRALLFPESLMIFAPLFVFVGFSLITGYLNGNSIHNIYADANAWLFFLLVWPLSLSIKNIDNKKIKFYFGVISVSVIWLVIKTWLVLYFFSHEFIIIGDFYKWIRNSGVGEITAMKGSFYRIFIQSHVYPLIALVITWYYLGRHVFKSSNLFELVHHKIFTKLVLVAGCLLSVILIGLSRSFWVGLFCALFSIIIIFFSRGTFILNLKKYLFFASSLLASFILSLLIILLIIKIPIPRNVLEFDPTSVLTDRVTETDESAIGSRWSMLPVLAQSIKQNILFGHGFGSTITYRSEDPRVIKTTGGQYTTFAFEWGWLDMWLKLGIFGLLAYVYLLVELWLMARRTPYVWPIRLTLITLVSLHVFTPYLNHPLGIGLILMISSLEFSLAEALPSRLKKYILHFINFKPHKT